jgi:hypothetical protein
LALGQPTHFRDHPSKILQVSIKYRPRVDRYCCILVHNLVRFILLETAPSKRLLLFRRAIINRASPKANLRRRN